jgi:hypothetical protein
MPETTLREKYESASKSYRPGSLERELHMIQLSITRCSCTAILWVSLVSFAAITLYVASQRVFISVVVLLLYRLGKKTLDINSYTEGYFSMSLKWSGTRKSLMEPSHLTRDQVKHFINWVFQKSLRGWINLHMERYKQKMIKRTDGGAFR